MSAPATTDSAATASSAWRAIRASLRAAAAIDYEVFTAMSSSPMSAAAVADVARYSVDSYRVRLGRAAEMSRRSLDQSSQELGLLFDDPGSLIDLEKIFSQRHHVSGRDDTPLDVAFRPNTGIVKMRTGLVIPRDTHQALRIIEREQLRVDATNEWREQVKLKIVNGTTREEDIDWDTQPELPPIDFDEKDAPPAERLSLPVTSPVADIHFAEALAVLLPVYSSLRRSRINFRLKSTLSDVLRKTYVSSYSAAYQLHPFLMRWPRNEDELLEQVKKLSLTEFAATAISDTPMKPPTHHTLRGCLWWSNRFEAQFCRQLIVAQIGLNEKDRDTIEGNRDNQPQDEDESYPSSSDDGDGGSSSGSRATAASSASSLSSSFSAPTDWSEFFCCLASNLSASASENSSSAVASAADRVASAESAAAAAGRNYQQHKNLDDEIARVELSMELQSTLSNALPEWLDLYIHGDAQFKPSPTLIAAPIASGWIGGFIGATYRLV